MTPTAGTAPLFNDLDLVIKVIEGGGVRTATLQRVRLSADKHTVFTGDATEPDDVGAFDSRTGNARRNYIPGFRSYLVAFDEGEVEKILTRGSKL